MKAWRTAKRQAIGLCVALVYTTSVGLLACWKWHESTQDVAMLLDYGRECTIYAQRQNAVIAEMEKRLHKSL